MKIYFQAMKVYFQALKIYFQGLKILFEAGKIYFRNVYRQFVGRIFGGWPLAVCRVGFWLFAVGFWRLAGLLLQWG